MTCPHCKGIFDEGASWNAFQYADSCPFCYQDVTILTCTDCQSTYDIDLGACPMCEAADNAVEQKRLEESIVPFDSITTLTPDEINKVATRAINVLYGMNKKGENPVVIISFISKYSGFIHSLWQYIVNMEKGVIPNGRATTEEKLKWAEAHMEFFYAEGSLFEDILENPANVKMQKIVETFVNHPQDDRTNGVKVYHALQDNETVLFKLLTRFMFLHQMCIPMFIPYIESWRKAHSSPQHKWSFVVKQTTNVMMQREFEIAPK